MEERGAESANEDRHRVNANHADESLNFRSEIAKAFEILEYLSETSRHSERYNHLLMPRRGVRYPRLADDEQMAIWHLRNRVAHGFERDAAALSADGREISSDFIQALLKILIRERPDIVESALAEYLENPDSSNYSDLPIFAVLATAAVENQAARRRYQKQLFELEKARQALHKAEQEATVARRELAISEQAVTHTKRALELREREAKKGKKPPPESQK